MPAKVERVSRLRDLIAPGSLALLLFAGLFKGSPLFRNVPIDLTLAGVAAVVAGIAINIIRENGPTRIGTWVWIGVAAVSIGLMTPAGNPYASDARTRMLLVALGMIGALYLVNTYRRQRVWVLLYVIIGVAMLYLQSQQTGIGALGSEFSNTIATGRAIGGAIVVLITLALSGWPRPILTRLGMAAGALLLGGALIDTGSRGALLSVVAALLLVAATMPGRGRVVRIACSAAAIVAGWFMLWSAQTVGAARLQGTLSGQYDATASRAGIWQDAINSTLIRPVGVGWGNFFDAQKISSQGNSGYRVYAHNVILQTFSEGGWIAGLATIIFIIVALRRFQRNAGHPIGATLFAIAMFEVLAAMSSGDLNDNRMMWAVLAMAWVVKPPPRS